MRFIAPASLLFVAFALTVFPAHTNAQLPAPPDSTLSAQGAAPDEQAESAEATHLKSQIALLFKKGNFAEIDRIADKVRADKSTLPGGGWKITRLYKGLAVKELTPDERIAKIKTWIVANPQSITAHVALAKAYLHAASVKPGDGGLDQMTLDQAKQQENLVEQAKMVLDDSASMTPMCPEWFSAMQEIASKQHWNKKRVTALFEQAVAFEPEYYYYYQSYARFLLPNHHGKNGDDVAFTQKVADSIGGTKGDFIYYKISSVVLGICGCTLEENPLDWGRLQRGYQILGQMHPYTVYDLNQYALFAWRFHDREQAKKTFEEIGDRWSVQVWRKQSKFIQARRWAGLTSE
jgi:hypothetical protein